MAIISGSITQGDDDIICDDANDYINALAGDDQVRGGGGNDTLIGGEGTRNWLYGEDGNDRLSSAGTDDFLDPGLGLDTVSGNIYIAPGIPNAAGGSGTLNVDYSNLTGDVLLNYSNRKNGTIIEGDGSSNSVTFTGILNLVLSTGWGNDNLDASNVSGTGFPRITLSAGAGSDTLTGGSGFDNFWAGEGDDFLNVGSSGLDTMDGGDGNDTLTVIYGLAGTTGAVSSTVDGLGRGSISTDVAAPLSASLVYANIEQLNLTTGDFDDSLIGSVGNDIIFSNAGNDSVNGGSGSDIINGGTDNDTLHGGNGSDSLLGGLGSDSLQGGNQADTLSGGDDNDILFGGNSEDHLEAGAGNDRLAGGNGNDTLLGAEGFDTLTGGANADDFVFGAPELTFDQIRVDRINDFNPVDGDRIVLSLSTFTWLPVGEGGSLLDNPDSFALATTFTGAAISTGIIVYNSTNGRLFYNTNGTESGFGEGGGYFAAIAGMPSLSASDIWVMG